MLPAHLRPAVRAIYDFARCADDIADEGHALPSERTALLEAYEEEIRHLPTHKDPTALAAPFTKLHPVIRERDLPTQQFLQLLSAFKQDVVTTRYVDFESLLDYCHRSADPIGNLMLHLYGAATPANIRQSDAVCSALQIINFLQDVAIDWSKGRIYLPLEDMKTYGVQESHIAVGTVDGSWIALMTFQVQRARQLMLSGAPLALNLPGRIGWELRFVINGGLRILQLLENNDYDVFNRRPVLKFCDWIVIGWRSLTMHATR